MDKSKKIGIIGAGASGISTAYFLHKKGYRHVFLLEKENRIGGKCHTIQIAGRPYELGGGLHNASYTALKEMIHDCRIRYRPSLVNFKKEANFIDFSKGLIYEDHRHLSSYSSFNSWCTAIKFLSELIKFRYCDHIYEELCVPFMEWLELKKMKDIAHWIGWFTTGFGYGYLEEIPALYLLRYLSANIPPFVFNQYEVNDIGYQGLWEAIAQPLEIHVGTQIINIKRNKNIIIETVDQTFNCDVLIFACPLDDTLSFTDSSQQEKELFSKIRYYDYHAVCLSLDQPLPKKLGLVVNRILMNSAGGVIFYYRHWEQSPVCLTYHLGRSSIGMQTTLSPTFVEEQLKVDMHKIGRQVQDIHLHKIWKYFPHVSSAEIKSGFYQQLDQLQGHQNTYYLGELLSFSTVGASTNYAKALIHRFF